MRSRPPRQLLLAFLGEFVLDRYEDPVRAAVLIEVLEGAGVAAPAARATLDRMVARGLLERKKQGREIEFTLTDEARAVLHEGGERVNEREPFAPIGGGWTLVTFSVPERQRTLRHRLRSLLTWEGFAPLRDGLWLAPGEVDLAAGLAPVRDDLPPASITAFRASEIDGFSVADSIAGAWDIDGIRAAHEEFIDTWAAAGTRDDAASAASARTMLVADWLALLRADPRLPADFLAPDWPAARSTAVYRARQAELDAPAAEEFARLLGVRALRVGG